MVGYYVNKNAQTNGDHEVQRGGCSKLLATHNQINLGEYYTCSDAVRAARNYNKLVDGCYYRSYDCHT